MVSLAERTDVRDDADRNWPRSVAGPASATSPGRRSGNGLHRLPVSTSPQRWVAATVVGAKFVTSSRCAAYSLSALLASHAMRPVRSVEWRMALAAVHRPGALRPPSVLSLGSGLAALVALTLIDANLRAELASV